MLADVEVMKCARVYTKNGTKLDLIGTQDLLLCHQLHQKT